MVSFKRPAVLFVHLSDQILLISLSDKTIKLWKVSERDKRAEGYNLKEDGAAINKEPNSINSLRVRDK
jgi:hypothetical protein